MPPVAPGAPPLVGRTAELAVLRAALDAARSGAPGAVLVEADAGVGKSRLVAELQRTALDAGDVTVLVGHCASAGGGALPYLPFVEALAPLQRDTTAAWWSARDTAGELAQLQLFDAVSGLLGTAARERCVLLVLEDLHWADAASRDLLTHLVRRTRDERLLLVGTVRTDDVHRRHPLRAVLAELGRLPAVRRVALSPFTQDETRAYLAGLAGADVPGATARGIHARAEGNAYYAGELLLASAPARGGAPLPEALADVVLARVEALPAEAAEVVRAAAAGGRRVRHELLRAAAGLEEDVLDRGLRDAVALRVLDADGAEGYRFRHALLHEASRTSRAPYGVQLLLLQATACFVTGRFARAEEIAGGVGPQGPRAVASAVAVVAAHVAAATGHPERARELAGGLVDEPFDRATAAAAVAEADRWDGHPRRAAQRLLDVVEGLTVEDPAHLMGLRLGAQALGALADARDAGDGGDGGDGDLPTGDRLLARVEGIARTGQPRAGALGPEGRAWVLVARAEHARLRGAPPAELVAAWGEAVRGFAHGAAYEAARCRRRLAEALVAAGRREEGLVQLRAARTAAAQLGAAPLAAALEDLARRVRADPAAPAGPLTAREAQVLELLAEGLTNRQVGQRLFLAEKTASVHVSRILAKLGASSRAEAVSIALRSGMLAGSG
ncbi:AAA family ATPase [Kineococcus indalonis]|uniref:AAA family ATPase n=1 Tax=Kineococcus indalonis TaxID=2696566 RepID=UPI00196B25DC|nr:helix-turn-helix transcriptional regulator [Kineococcus indalonis]